MRTISHQVSTRTDSRNGRSGISAHAMDNGSAFSKPVADATVLKQFQAKQEWYQKRQAQIGLSYMLGKGDRVTSVLIPCAMGLVGAGMTIRALHSLYTGTNKGDQ